MVSCDEALTRAAKLLNGSCDAPLREARLLLAYVCRCGLAKILSGTADVSDGDAALFYELVKKRADGCPLAYIFGEKEFFSLKFRLNGDTLIPRSDTETLVEFILDCKNITTLFDICTGSGCIAIAAAANNKKLDVCGTDISHSAVAAARANADLNGVSDRAHFFVSDISETYPSKKFDMAVSNPPYIKKSDLAALDRQITDFEPLRALDGGADGLDFYRRICAFAPRILNDNGILAFEVGYNQYDEVESLMQPHFKEIAPRRDIAGVKRVIYGVKR